jgi:hypothetical protein
MRFSVADDEPAEKLLNKKIRQEKEQAVNKSLRAKKKNIRTPAIRHGQ